jgi:hypothetical protein
LETRPDGQIKFAVDVDVAGASGSIRDVRFAPDNDAAGTLHEVGEEPRLCEGDAAILSLSASK